MNGIWLEKILYIFQLGIYVLTFFLMMRASKLISRSELYSIIRFVIMFVVIVGVIQWLLTMFFPSGKILLKYILYNDSNEDVYFNFNDYFHNRRIYSTFMEPSYMAAFAVGAFYYLLSFWNERKKNLWLLALLLTIIIVSFSSTAYGAFGITGLLFISSTKEIKRSWKIVIIFVGCIGLLLFAVSFRETLDAVLFSKSLTGSASTRARWNNEAFDAFLTSPLWGIGYDNHYDYYHIISGADLPIKTNSYIDSFFEKNNGLEFIDFDDEKLNADPEISRRTRIYHLLQNLRRISPNKHLNNAFIFCERVLLLIQIILRVDRTKKLDWTIKYGSQWVSITDGLVKEILSKKAKIRSVFKYTNCADELFIQTVAYNSDFRHKIYKGSTREAMNNMRIVDWKRGKNGSPYTFREDDFSTLGNTDALFARKFSQEIDKSIIVKITDYLEDGVTA